MIAQYLYEECIQYGSDASDKPALLKEIARLAKRSPILSEVSEEVILQGLMNREQLGSTGFGDEIAIPHCALDTIPNFVIGILCVPQGIDFETLDGKKAKLFVFIIAPKEQQNEHIRVLSSISGVLRFPEHVRELLATKDASAIRESFLRHTKPEAEKQAEKQFQQFTVMVQREEIFEDILSVFTEIDECFVSVIESNNARKYLYALPLFSNFWNEEQKGFQRVILAVVNRGLANEVIRNVNLILEHTEEAGVVLFMQDITYLNGSISL